MSGKVGDLSPKQAAALKQFRQRIADIWQPHFDDYFLLKWLRARDFVPKDSEEMLRKSLLYRKEMKLDTLVDTFEWPEACKKYFPGGFIGNDKEGCPILLVRAGNLDHRGLYHSMKRDDYLKFCLYFLEEALRLTVEQSNKLGRKIETITIIMDLENYGLKRFYRPAVSFYAVMAVILEDNYPELIKQILVLKAPRLFYIMYAIIKPFLTEVTRSKIHITTNNFEGILFDSVDSDVIPKALGGNRVDEDGDPYLRSLFGVGGDIPKAYYVTENGHLTRPIDEYSKVVIGSRDTLQIEKEVEITGSVLRWEFKTDDHNLGFGVQKLLGEQETQPTFDVVPILRRDCHITPEEGTYICDDPGKYTLIFDNSFSWSRSKVLHYMVEVIAPETENGNAKSM